MVRPTPSAHDSRPSRLVDVGTTRLRGAAPPAIKRRPRDRGRPTCAAYGFTNATAYHLVAESVAHELLSPSRSYICVGSGCGDLVLDQPEPNLVSWGLGGGAIAVAVGLALLRLGRAIRPVRDTAVE